MVQVLPGLHGGWETLGRPKPSGSPLRSGAPRGREEDAVVERTAPAPRGLRPPVPPAREGRRGHGRERPADTRQRARATREGGERVARGRVAVDAVTAAVSRDTWPSRDAQDERAGAARRDVGRVRHVGRQPGARRRPPEADGRSAVPRTDARGLHLRPPLSRRTPRPRPPRTGFSPSAPKTPLSSLLFQQKG